MDCKCQTTCKLEHPIDALCCTRDAWQRLAAQTVHVVKKRLFSFGLDGYQLDQFDTAELLEFRLYNFLN